MIAELERGEKTLAKTHLEYKKILMSHKIAVA
jgi:hypothetical protein